MIGIYERGAGVLCPISSLPNEYGIGTLGDEAYEFARLLKKAGVKYWQILPTVQTSFGDSPYQSVCCFSGNPYFIDLKSLYRNGLLDEEELQSAVMPQGDIDYAKLYECRFNLLRLAYARFNVKDKEFTAFVESKEFDDYALFMSLKSRYSGTFDTLPDAYKFREKLAMLEFRRSIMKSDFLFWQFVQFIYRQQWNKLRAYVNSLGIKIIGDIPLYVAYDSSDVWSHPELFRLDRNLRPTMVAGVPPDYFSKSGQLWGNPIYNWDVMCEDGFDWFVKRIEKAKNQFDIIRIDHFRGFDRFYAVPEGKTDATEGEWFPGPGVRLFYEIRRKIGEVNIIAEDLGITDGGVVRLMERTGFPGMKVLQFAFDGNPSNAYLPENIKENSVVYTGTHDNDTTLGFLNGMTDVEFYDFKKQLRAALKSEGAVYPFVTREQAVYAMNNCALATNANIAILPVQDVMCLDGGARMNVPSTPDGNWKFRLQEMPSRRDLALLKRSIEKYDR